MVNYDPVSDNTGGMDITRVYAILNDAYLYLMFEIAGKLGEYVQIDVDINPRVPGGWPPDYLASVRPYDNPFPYLSRMEGGQLVSRGEQGNAVLGSVFEMRIPLQAFDGPLPETVNLFVFEGKCCGDKWIATETTLPSRMLQTDEIEPPFISKADIRAPDSAFGQERALQYSESFPPAPIGVPGGYAAEYFIQSTGLNMPSDVVVTKSGEIIVNSRRSFVIHRLEPDGTLSLYAPVHTCTLDQDGEGNLYGYFTGSGEIYRINPGQMGFIIARMPQTPCSSDFAVAPDGTIYVGFNRSISLPTSDSTLYVIAPGGGTPRALLSVKMPIASLDVTADGTLYAVIGDSLNIIDTTTGIINIITRLPEWGSNNGLVVADDGTAYVSTGEVDISGRLFRIEHDGEVDVLASIEDNGLEGIAISPDGEIIGVQRAIGGLLAIGPDGSVRTLIKPSGLVSPQTLAFSPCGELITVNDEAHRLTLATPDGHNRLFTLVISFQPPQTYVAFSPAGWYVVGESAPDFPSLLNRYLPNGFYETLADDIPDVSGIAVGLDGSIYASATIDGQIIRIKPDGKREIVADGLSAPQSMVIGADGVLYATTGGEINLKDINTSPMWGDTVVSIAEDGSVSLLAKIPGACSLALGPDGWLYVAGADKVYRISPTGNTEIFASGFGRTRGVAFNVAGNLYIADELDNNIICIRGFPQSELRGLVTDTVTGEPIEKARVQVVQANPPFAGRMLETDTDGAFSLPIAPGTYTVTSWADGYNIDVILDVIVDYDPQEVGLSLMPEGE